MHKNFYASGFIYHPSSQQILLQQNNSMSPASAPWELFGGSYEEHEGPESFFKQLVSELLNIQVKTVYSIYSYVDENTNESCSIAYTKVKKAQDFPSKNGMAFVWFSFKEALKLKLTEQTKHNIIVGQRVIDAAGRKRRGEHTFQ